MQSGMWTINGPTPPEVAVRRYANTFPQGPQTFAAGAANQPATVMQGAVNPTVALSQWKDATGTVQLAVDLTGTFRGQIHGPTDANHVCSIDLSAGGSSAGQVVFSFKDTSFFFSGVYSIFGTNDTFFQISPFGNLAYAVLEGSATAFAIGTNNNLTPLIFYISRANYAAATSAEVARFDTDGTFQIRGNDASNVVQTIAKFTQAFADPADATWRGKLTYSVGDHTAQRNYFIATSDGSEAIVTLGSGCVFQNTNARSRLTADNTNATNVFQNLTDLSLTLVAGRKYTGYMSLRWVNSVPADGVALDFNGGTATMTNFWAGSGVAGFSTSLAGVISRATLPSEAVEIFSISIECNAAGTFIPRFKPNTPTTGTMTVRRGSFMLLEDSPI